MTDASLLNIRPAAALLDAVPAAPSFILDPILSPGTLRLIYGAAGRRQELPGAGARPGGRRRRQPARLERGSSAQGAVSRRRDAARRRGAAAPPVRPAAAVAGDLAGDRAGGSRLDLSTWEGIVRLMASWTQSIWSSSTASRASPVPPGTIPSAGRTCAVSWAFSRPVARSCWSTMPTGTARARQHPALRHDGPDHGAAPPARLAAGRRRALRASPGEGAGPDRRAPRRSRRSSAPAPTVSRNGSGTAATAPSCCRATPLLQQGMSAEAVGQGDRRLAAHGVPAEAAGAGVGMDRPNI